MTVASVLALVLFLPLQPSTATQELVGLEEVWNTAQLEGNAAALEILWADSFTATVPGMSVMSRTDALAAVRSNMVTFSKYGTSDVVVRAFGQAAVVQGRMRRVRQRGDSSVEDDWQFTKVYVKENGRWKVVVFHASESPK